MPPYLFELDLEDGLAEPLLRAAIRAGRAHGNASVTAEMKGALLRLTFEHDVPQDAIVSELTNILAHD